MIKFLFAKSFKSSAQLAGLFCIVVLLLSGCQTGKTPEQVTQQFWQSLAQGQVDAARQNVTESSQNLVHPQDIDKLSPINLGESEDEDDYASVATSIYRNKKRVSFNTVLTKEHDVWKIDYLQTQMNISMLPFGEVIKSLQNLGGVFTRQLEQQMPQIQKEMESLGNTLKNQIEQLGRSLEKSGQTNKSPSQSGGI